MALARTPGTQQPDKTRYFSIKVEYYGQIGAENMHLDWKNPVMGE